MDSTRSLPITDTPIAQEPPTVERESSGIVGPVLGSNKFASLISLKEEQEQTSFIILEMNSMDLTTPSRKRILQKIPVKPSAKTRDILPVHK